MKKFDTHSLNSTLYEKELTDFKNLLDSKPELSEKHDILPFFKERPNLSSQIATLHTHINKTDKLAYEFDLFGDFSADIAVGDTHSIPSVLLNLKMRERKVYSLKKAENTNTSFLRDWNMALAR